MALSTPKPFKLLEKILGENPDLDIFSINLFDPNATDALSWKGAGRARERLIGEMQAFQRLAKWLGYRHDALIFQLMDRGILSAVHVAALPKQKFISQFGDLFEEESQSVEELYARALSIRSQLLLAFMQARQNHEPHALQSVITPNSPQA